MVRVDWSGSVPGNLIHVERRGSHLYLEGGRPDWPGRGHEGWGGTWTIEEVRFAPDRFLGEVPGLHDEVMGALADRHRVVDAPTATLSILADDASGWTAEVLFVVDGDRVFVPVDVEELAPHRGALLERGMAGTDVELTIADPGGDGIATLVGTASIVSGDGWLDVPRSRLAVKYPRLRSALHERMLLVDVVVWDPAGLGGS